VSDPIDFDPIDFDPIDLGGEFDQEAFDLE